MSAENNIFHWPLEDRLRLGLAVMDSMLPTLTDDERIAFNDIMTITRAQIRSLTPSGGERALGGEVHHG